MIPPPSLNEQIYAFVQEVSLKYNQDYDQVLAGFFSDYSGGDMSRLLQEDCHHHDSNPIKYLSSDEIFLYILLVIFCLLCAAFASGLTQGLLSLNVMELKIKSFSKNSDERKYAIKLLPLLSFHHLMLVTFMLWNATAMEALPIFLSKLCSEYVAIIISVTCVLIFGEIIPASILTGPKQLQIVSALIPLVYFIIFIFFPIAYPIAKALDYLIGIDDGITIYNKNDLKSMIKIQFEEKQRKSTASSPVDLETGISNKKNKKRVRSSSNGSHIKYELVENQEIVHSSSFLDSIKKFDDYVTMLINQFTKTSSNHAEQTTINPVFTNTKADYDPLSPTTFPIDFNEDHNDVKAMEYNIINGALTYSDKKVNKIMTKIHNIFLLNSNEVLNYELLYKIFQSGYSRIPVCDSNNPNEIIGLLIVKDLIFIDPDDNIILSNFIKVFGRIPITLWYDDTLDSALKVFQQTNSHMAVVKSINYYNNIKDPEYIIVGIITLEDILEEILGKKIYDETDKTNKKLNKIIKDYDWERLKVLKNTKKTVESIYRDSEFVNELILFIHNNIKQIGNFYNKYSNFNLKKFIEQIGLLKITKTSAAQIENTPIQNISMSQISLDVPMTPQVIKKKFSSDDIIIRCGKITTSCIIVISGIIRVIEGEVPEASQEKDSEFRDDSPSPQNSPSTGSQSRNKEYLLGPWSIINQEVLNDPQGTYFSRITAVIESEEVRIFCLSYNLYEKFMRSNKLARLNNPKNKKKNKKKASSDYDDSDDDSDDTDEDIGDNPVLSEKEKKLKNFYYENNVNRSKSDRSPVNTSTTSLSSSASNSSTSKKTKKSTKGGSEGIRSLKKTANNVQNDDNYREDILNEYCREMESTSLIDKKKPKSVQFIDDSEL